MNCSGIYISPCSGVLSWGELGSLRDPEPSHPDTCPGCGAPWERTCSFCQRGKNNK